MASRIFSSPIVSVAVIVVGALCATPFGSRDPSPRGPVAPDDDTEILPLTRQDLGDVPHRVRDHSGGALAAPHGRGRHSRESALVRRPRD